MKKIKTIIIDDEPIAISILQTHAKSVELLEVIGTFREAISAFNFLIAHNVDLMFLDIKMPQMTGLEFLNSLTHPPKVILTTAYSEFALEGYNYGVIDYLLKPIPFDRFVKSVEKVLPQLPRGSAEDEYLFIRTKGKLVRVRLKDVRYVESQVDHANIVMKDRLVETDKSISAMEEILPKTHFLRIHRAFVVAYDHIDAFSTRAVIIGKNEFVIGRKYKEEALKSLEERFGGTLS